MKITFLSDTHGMHNEFSVGEGDVLVHSGDAEIITKDCAESFLLWLSNQKYKHKIFVPGNHDLYCEEGMEPTRDMCKKLGIHYLINEEVIIDGLKFWGNPYVPIFGYWSFMSSSNKLKEYASLIPIDTDILITHGPPKHILDNPGRGPCGDDFLIQKVNQIKPIIHAFGHIHEAYGFKNFNDILFINAAVCPSFLSSKEKEPWTVTLEDKKVSDIIQCPQTS